MAITRTVKEGDTLSQIASEFGVGINDISGFSSGNPDLIRPGEKLTINKPVQPVNRINAADLGQSEFKAPPVVPSTGPKGLAGLAESTQERIDSLTPKVDEAREDIESVYSELGNKSKERVEAYASEETAFGTVNVAQKELQDINSKIKQRELRARRKIEAIQDNNPTGQLTEGQQIAIDKVEREWAREAADLAIVAEVKMGNYEGAKGIVDDRIDAEIEDLTTELAGLEFFYTENFNQLSDERKTLLQQETAIVEQEIADTRELMSQIGEIQIEAATNGAPAETIMSIGKATDMESALVAAGRYVGLLDRQREARLSSDGGDGPSTIKFTDTQIQKGAANAGMSIQEFQALDQDSKNFYINTFNDLQGEIDTAFEEGSGLEDILATLDESPLEDQPRAQLRTYAETQFESTYRPPTEEEVREQVRSTLTNLNNQGYSRSEAQDAVTTAFTTDAKGNTLNLPKSQKKIIEDRILDELVTVYGQTWGQWLFPGGR